MSALVSHGLTTDERFARVFLKMLDADRLWWEVRTFDDVVLEDGTKREDPELITTLKISCADMRAGSPKLAKLIRLNQQGAGVFVTINRTDGKGKSKENVTEVTALFADTDGAPLEPLLALQPHVVIQSSPGNWHVYWRVSDCALDQFTPMQEAITEKFGTDKSVKDLPRVLRLPGFYHCKGEPQFVTFCPEHMDTDPPPPYTAQEIVAGLGLSVGAKRTKGARALDGLSGRAPVALDAVPGNIVPHDPPPAETVEEVAKVRTMLAAISPDVGREEWMRVVWAVLAYAWACAVDLAREWSMTSREVKWNEKDFDGVVASFDPNRADGIGYRSLEFIAREYDWTPPNEVTVAVNTGALDGEIIPPGAVTPSGKPMTLADLNERYFLSQIGGGVFIFDERAKNIVDAALSNKAFELLYNNRNHDGKPLGTTWLRWQRRRDYEEVVFDPSRCAPADKYNLYRGLAVKPCAGDCELIRKHIYQVWCGSNRAQFEYVICWLAYAVQFPHLKPEVAIVLRSKQGSGKNIIADMVRGFFGRHGYTSANKDQVAGRFTGHLLDKILVVLDEAFFAGDPAAVAILNVLITSPEMGYEPKFKSPFTAPNYAHVIMTTNHDWAVPAAEDARRFAVLDVSNRRKGDFAYFAALRNHIDSGGSEAFLDVLLNLDLRGFDPRKLPQTLALADQRKQTMLNDDPVKKWWWGALTEREFPMQEGALDWGASVDADLLRRSYEHSTRLRARGAPPPPPFHEAMKKVREFVPAGSLKKYRPRDCNLRRNVYHLPPLNVARAKFRQETGVEVDADDAPD
jgi:hypothetical protein